ncbi:hypothetical protein D3C81_755730 [compost metagenome]
MMRLEVERSTDLDRGIADRHYLQSVPAGAKLRLWVLDDQGKRIGAMMWGRPTARSLDRERLLELTRMCMIDETDAYVESRALSLARKHIRKHLPQIKGLLAYSSTGEGHKGTVYLADGWFPFGLTDSRKQGWANRSARSDRDISRKIRWLRSP